MLARLCAFVVWGLVAATAVFWALRLGVQAPEAPAYTVAVGSIGPAHGDLTRLLGTTAHAAAAPIATPQATSRFKLFGIMAPDGRHAATSQAGLALIAVDDKPARAFAVGASIDDGLVLQSVSLRTASIGPAEGETTLRLELPALPEAATGTLAPARGFASPSGAGVAAPVTRPRATTPNRSMGEPPAPLPARVPVAPRSTLAPGQRGAATR